MKDVESIWDSIWKEILELPDGQINVPQLKKELADYSDLIDRMSKLTCEITGSKLSYPTYPVEVILQAMEDFNESVFEDMRRDDKEDGFCHFCNQEITAPTDDKER